MKRRHALTALAMLVGCAHRHTPAPTVSTAGLAPLADETAPVTDPAAPTTTTTSTTETPTTRPRVVIDAPRAGDVMNGTALSVTAYCQAGTMADGRRTYVGAAAGNRWPFGTRLNVAGYGTVTVEDRIGSGSDLDIFMPSCSQAIAWGRRWLRVSPA